MTVPAALKARREKITAEHGNYPTETPADPATPEAPNDANADPATLEVPVEGVTGFDESLFAVPADPGSNVPTAAPAAHAAHAAQVPTAGPADDSWQQRYRSLQGMFDAKNEEIRLLKQRLDALERQPAVPPPQAPVPAAAPAPAQIPTGNRVVLRMPDVPALTPEQATQYEKSIPVIRRLAADTIAEVMAPVLDRIATVEGALAQHAQGYQQTQSAVVALGERGFKQSLRLAVPDIDAISKTPAFVAFLATPVPYSGGLTVRDRLKAAYEAQDTNMIVSIMNDFRGSKSSAGQQQQPTPAHFQQPGGQGGQPTAAPEPQSKPKLAWSKRTEASVKFRKHLISAAELQRISDLYEQAMKEGRVDMNA